MSIASALRRMPVRSRLRAIVLLIGGLGVLGSCSTFLAYQVITARARLAQQLAVLAEVVAEQSVATVEFRDPRAATSILASLSAVEDVRAAAIFDRDGRVFARFLREGTKPSDLPRAVEDDGTRFDASGVRVFRPVSSAGERIGTFYVRSSLASLRRLVAVNVVTVVLVLAGAGTAMMLLAGRLGDLVIGPALALAEVATTVARRRDYSLRAPAGGDDEIGRLQAAFNDMLAQIQARDQALETARAELEERVGERTRELELANHELEGFSYSVSHDLRAPLRAIGGYARMLVEDCADRLDAEGRRYLAVITDNTEKMGQLIDDLLSFSRMARSALEPAAIDMTRLVRDVFAAVTERDPGRARPELVLGELPAGRGDPAMLRVAVENLLANAVKYSRERPQPRIEVGGRVEGGDCVYWVRDNGVGFDQRYAGKLFGVFQRLHPATRFEGTGVGLALVQRIVHRHGGSVRAEGQVDAGATFTFTLPRSAPGAPSAAPAAAPALAPGPTRGLDARPA